MASGLKMYGSEFKSVDLLVINIKLKAVFTVFHQ